MKIQSAIRFLAFLILAFLFLECRSTSNQSNNHKAIPIIDIGKQADNREIEYLSKYSTNIDYIPLETCQEGMIADALYTKMRIHDNKFYFFSQQTSYIRYCVFFVGASVFFLLLYIIIGKIETIS